MGEHSPHMLVQNRHNPQTNWLCGVFCSKFSRPWAPVSFIPKPHRGQIAMVTSIMFVSPSSRPKKDLYQSQEICAGNAGDKVTRSIGEARIFAISIYFAYRSASHCWHLSPGSWVNVWGIQHVQMFGDPAPQTIDDTVQSVFSYLIVFN